MRAEGANVAAIRVELVRAELVGDDGARAERRGRSAQPDHRLSILRDNSACMLGHAAEHRLVFLAGDRAEADVDRRAGEAGTRQRDAQPAGLAAHETEVRAVVRSAPAVRVDAAAERAQAVRLRQLDQAPLTELRRPTSVEVGPDVRAGEVDAGPILYGVVVELPWM